MAPRLDEHRQPYHALSEEASDDGSDTVVDQEGDLMIEKSTFIIRRGRIETSKVFVSSLIVILGASLLGNLVLLLSFISSRDLDQICVKHTSEYWSPLMDGVKLRYDSVQFDGSFLNKSIYVQSPSPAVDKAWSDLGIDFRTTVIPEKYGKAAGIDHSAVKVKASLGGGYVVNFEGLHHLHCLNMIRQTLPWNVDYYRDRNAGVYLNSEPIVQLHVDHCLDTVRQQLQCTTDLGMFGQRWIQRPGKDMNVFPIFDTRHTCRNFEDILAWVRDHQAPDGLVAEVRDDDVILHAYT